MIVKVTIWWNATSEENITYHDTEDPRSDLWIKPVAVQLLQGYEVVMISKGGTRITYEAADPDDVMPTEDVVAGLRGIVADLAKL